MPTKWKPWGLICWLAVSWGPAFSQASLTLSGTIRAQETGEQLGYVMVRDSLSGRGTLTNAYGFFSLPVPAGQQTLRFYAPGYEPVILRLALQQDSTLNLSLRTSALVDTVRIREVRPYSSQDVRSSAIVIPIEQLKRTPVLGGGERCAQGHAVVAGGADGGRGHGGFVRARRQS